MSDVTLTPEERATLWEAIGRAFLDLTTYDRASEENIDHTVQRIVAARVAAVETERDRWETRAEQAWRLADDMGFQAMSVHARLDAVLAAVEGEMRGDWANRHHVNGWAVVRVNDLRAAVAAARGDS